ncbi:MAG: SsrA-binding protein SmpB [Verrucomicrobiota bacterium]|nr:SsrA-binding protein SmpB [Verrucomicrobiota bacterium]
MGSKGKEKELVSNRKAFHDYEILETYEAGIQLLGTEIASLKNHGGALRDAYVDMRGSAPWLINASIAPYSFGNQLNHEERRPRKLLMHKREIVALERAVSEKGLTLIPLAIYLNSRGFAKLRLAIARGKKQYDVRAAVKERDQKRALLRGED